MTFFTGKGDDGTTSFFGSARRYSKDSPLAWALGTLDEINSFLGLCKVKSRESNLYAGDKKIEDVLDVIQQNLFIVQGELAGASMFVGEEKVLALEEIIRVIEEELPPIKSFLISGATEESALFDVARTLARRAERSVVSLVEEERPKESTLAYLNRLSSALYAFARLSAYKAGKEEEKPTYQ